MCTYGGGWQSSRELFRSIHRPLSQKWRTHLCHLFIILYFVGRCQAGRTFLRADLNPICNHHQRTCKAFIHFKGHPLKKIGPHFEKRNVWTQRRPKHCLVLCRCSLETTEIPEAPVKVLDGRNKKWIENTHNCYYCL